jgi:pimeloyl-ACP methyl ester carboxylesterase
MLDPALQLDQQYRAPLAKLAGAKPDAPPWFTEALALEPERQVVEVEGAGIELLTWGERGQPGLMFVHGGRAHADWWSFIAPFFARNRRVAALSLSGMGRSDWRERYGIGQYSREVMTAMRAAGLCEAAVPPLLVGHSFGSRPLFFTAASSEIELAGAVVLDSAISAPDAPDYQLAPGRPNRVYDSLEQALAHFRLMPMQPCDNLFILDHIARHSLKPATREDGGPNSAEEGWTWRFDPFLMDRIGGEPGDQDPGKGSLGVRAEADAALRAARCRLAFVKGELSAIVREANLAYTRSIAPAGTQFSSVPNAAHHLFLDQPLAVVESLSSIFKGWGL